MKIPSDQLDFWHRWIDGLPNAKFCYYYRVAKCGWRRRMCTACVCISCSSWMTLALCSTSTHTHTQSVIYSKTLPLYFSRKISQFSTFRWFCKTEIRTLNDFGSNKWAPIEMFTLFSMSVSLFVCVCVRLFFAVFVFTVCPLQVNIFIVKTDILYMQK